MLDLCYSTWLPSFMLKLFKTRIRIWNYTCTLHGGRFYVWRNSLRHFTRLKPSADFNYVTFSYSRDLYFGCEECDWAHTWQIMPDISRILNEREREFFLFNDTICDVTHESWATSLPQDLCTARYLAEKLVVLVYSQSSIIVKRIALFKYNVYTYAYL